VYELTSAEGAAAAVADPTTSAADLFEIAGKYPSLWPKIARHPNTYPDLLKWLGNVGDTGVKNLVGEWRPPGPPLSPGPPAPPVPPELPSPPAPPGPPKPGGEAPKPAVGLTTQTYRQPPSPKKPIPTPEELWPTADPIPMPDELFRPPDEEAVTIPDSPPPLVEPVAPAPVWPVGAPYAPVVPAPAVLGNQGRVIPTVPMAAPERAGMSNTVKALIVVLATVVLLAGALIIVAKVLGDKVGPQPAPTTQPTQPATQPTQPTQPATQPTQPATQPTQPVPAGDPQAAAAEQLNTRANDDVATVNRVLFDHWTTLLSVKKDGLVYENKTWHYTDIWDEYTQLKQRYPEAVLVHAGAWPSFNLGNEWYGTTSGIVFPDSNAALAWCAAEKYDKSHCVAFRIANSQSGNLVQPTAQPT